jgi:predicted transcriptional regulator
MVKTLVEMAAEIVQAQAGVGRMSPEEIEACLHKTFFALTEINNKEQGIEAEEIKEDDKLENLRKNPMSSIQRNCVVDLETGQEFKIITNRHLKKLGMTTKAYKKKWGIPLSQPLSAKSLTAKRRKLAQERGLGEMLKKARQKKTKK